MRVPPLSISSRNALAPSASTITPTAADHGKSGNSTSSSIFANLRSTSTDRRKLSFTSGWARSVAFFTTPMRKRRRGPPAREPRTG